ncbi:hypothetical protein IJG90_02715 [Candidatus Saccharibacteria bacterium]|nr:hypothetical protein [Candidatus Saccharibacteria bacterium]
MANAAKNKKVVSTRRKVQASTVRSRKKIQTLDEQASEAENIVVKVQKKSQPEIILHSSKRIEVTDMDEKEQPTIIINSTNRIDKIEASTEQDSNRIDEILSNVKEREVVSSIDLARVRTRAKKRIRLQNSPSESQRQPRSGRELKENAIERALVAAADERRIKRINKDRHNKVHFGFRRTVLALACAAAAVFAIVYFVNLNSPNITLKVAAMQSGIDASYPSYIPRDFNLSDITSESGKITLNFRNASTGDNFKIIEERSSWDSSALLSNYVRPTYKQDYSEVAEQGLTLFISGSDAAWTNGGVVYKLIMGSGSLTKKQIKAIAVSL